MEQLTVTTTTHQTTTLNVVELQEWLEETVQGVDDNTLHWWVCGECESGLSPVDIDTGRCTNCGVELAVKHKSPLA